tara:strand:- start:50 stop:430 length:381 start_codon:yes stop_codon:yes gene_type:complete
MKVYFLNPKKLNPIEDFDSNRVNWLKDKIKKEDIWTVPIAIAQEHNLVMDGHHRLQVALELNLQKIPCFIFSYNQIEPYSLREEEKVSSKIIIENFLKSKIFPYKTAKHDLITAVIKPINLGELYQ